MKIPTHQEVDDARDSVTREGRMAKATIGLSVVANSHPGLRAWVERNVAFLPELIRLARLQTWSRERAFHGALGGALTGALMYGLNIGIRIGEARGEHLVDALKAVKAFFQALEDNTEPDDPLLELRRKFHAPVHAAIDAALAKAEENAR